MRVLITGADGFIGRRLATRILHDPAVIELVLADLDFRDKQVDPRVRSIKGSLAEKETMDKVLSTPFDRIFHLACIAGGQAEENFDLGYAVNLQATMTLLEGVRRQAHAPVFVYSSSVGVYGDLPELVEDTTPPRPNWSYGTHKFMSELLVVDYTRKGWIDGRVLRFPGVVARPADPSGAVSAFLSDLIRTLAAGQPFVCPVSADAVSWWMSRECCIDNVLHGAELASARLNFYRSWMLPPLRATMREVVDAVSRVYKVDGSALVSYAPVPAVEERFGRLPPLRLPQAEALGFHHDGSLDLLVRNALL